MPYGMSKKIGGDTKAIDARMERCVKDLTAKGHNKLSAIAICKSSIQKSEMRKKKGR